MGTGLKKIKLSLGALLTLSVIGMPVNVMAQDLDVSPMAQATPIHATPFDRKFFSTGILDQVKASDPNAAESALKNASPNSLFFRARSFRYTSDSGGDRWQTPQETESKGSGDCEDKAVWLYTRLKQNGYDGARLVIGKYRRMEAKYHVWVSYQDRDGITHILDPAIQKRIWKTADFSSDFYHPIYSYDGDQRYKHLV